MQHPDPTASMETFLAHSSWVRRLALRLVQEDGHEADDLVQDTWLAVLERRAPHGTGIRGWLAKVLRHRWLDELRSNQRRSRREHAAASREALPSVAQIAERAALQKDLVEQVLSLPSAYREVVLLRYFGDLPPREVASRLGIPVETVRTRLKRALPRIRDGLERRWGSDAGELTPALAALAASIPGSSAVAASSVTSSLFLGVLAMKAKTVVGIAAVVVASAATTWVLRDAPTSPRESSPAVENDVARPPTMLEGREAVESILGVERVPERVTASDTERDGWIVKGRCIRGDDLTPFPGLEVHLLLLDSTGPDASILQETRVTADEDGRFQWPLATPEVQVLVKARAQGDGLVCYSNSQLVATGSPPPELVVTAYVADCFIEGIVRDPQGTAIAGATLGSSFGTVQSDAEGAYRIPAISSRRETRLDATASGYAPKRVTVHLGDSVTRVDFVLESAFFLSGRVVDEAGMPVRDASVQTFFTMQNPARTDADGRFVLDSLDPGREQHLVYARKEGYVEASTRVDSWGGGRELEDLVLRRGVRVEGIVLGAEDAALTGAQLYIGFTRSAYNVLTAETGEDGRFVFPHVGTGTQTLCTSYPGFAPETRVLELTEDVPVVDLTIRLAAGHFVGGVARNAAGEPLEGVWVSARQGREYTESRTRTDAEGRFRLESLPAKSVSLEFHGTGLVGKEVEVTDLDHEDLDVVLEAAAKLAGRVLDRATGEPLRTFTIRFQRPDPPATMSYGFDATWSREGHRFNDTDGYWDSGDEQLMDGAVFGIEARAEGYAPGYHGHVVASLEPDPEEFVIWMQSGARVVGTVRDARGDPVPEARLRIQSTASPEGRSFSEEVHDAGHTRSDARGAFVFEDVAPGSSQISVEVPGRLLFVDGPFDVPTTGTLTHDVILDSGTRLSGLVRGKGGAARAGAKVLLYAADGTLGDFYTETRTGDDGSFSFDGLVDGLYQLSHVEEAEGRSVMVLTRFVRVAGEATPDVVLHASGAFTLRGRLTAEGDVEIPSVVPVMVLPRATTISDERTSYGGLARAGRFEIPGIEPGDYQVTVYVSDPNQVLSGAAPVTINDRDVEIAVELVRQKER